MIDDNGIAAAAQMASLEGASPEVAGSELAPHATALDSINTTLKDSLQNMDIAQLKDVVTGENTLVKDALSSLIDMTISFVPKLIGAILVLWIGFKLTKLLKRSIIRMLDHRNAQSSLKGFLSSFLDVLLKVLIIIMAMDIIGIKATSFIAILGAMGLAVGMALQGTLQNFAGGVIILLLKPFKVGDYIECNGYKGYVTDIRIFHTIIRPFNGRTIIVPNSELATKSLINHTHEPIIRLDVTAGVAYGTDLKKAKEVLWDVINAEPLILQEPKKPSVSVSELADSSVNIVLWLWVKTEDYWTLWGRIRENIYNAFRENGIEIPFPQMDVHVKEE